MLQKLKALAIIALVFYPIIFGLREIFSFVYDFEKARFIVDLVIWGTLIVFATMRHNSKGKKVLNVISTILFTIDCLAWATFNELIVYYPNKFLKIYNRVSVVLFLFLLIKMISERNSDKEKTISVKSILGDYKPPVWISETTKKINEFAIKQKKKIFALLGIIVAICCVIFGIKKVNAYIESKKPINFTVEAYLTSTPYLYSYDSLKKPVYIEFNGSVAELSEIGKETTNLSINPAVNGKWTWESESRLKFEPSEEWKLGTHYTIRFYKALLASHITLSTPSVEFTTNDFSMNMSSLRFEIDDVDPNLKYLTFELTSDLPFDTSSFENKIKFTPDFKSSRNGTVEKRDYNAIVTFSDDKRTAYVRSEKIGIAATGFYMNAKVAKGIKSSWGGEEGNSKSDSVYISGADSYAGVNSERIIIAQNDEGDSEQVLSISFKGKVTTDDIQKALEVYVLPKDRPEEPGIRGYSNYHWNVEDCTEKVMSLSKKISFEKIETETKYSDTQNFKIDVPENSYIYFKIKKGVDFYGGYKLMIDCERVIKAPMYQRKLEIATSGTVLSMKGTHKIPIMTRGIDKVSFKIWRLKPDEINDIVYMSNGSMKNFRFDTYKFDESNVGVRYTDSKYIPNGKDDVKKATYSYFDFSKYLSTIQEKNLRNGIFVFEIEGEYYNGDYNRNLRDKRLILITDLGIITKNDVDDNTDIFVQSIQYGTPVSNASVKLIAKNGDVILESKTDEKGHVKFHRVSVVDSSQKPVAYTVSIDNDLSFMPYENYERRISFSDFDVGGLYGTENPNVIKSYIFSDRGIYKPGEEIRFGSITKSGVWEKTVEGLTCKYELKDPKGNTFASREFQIGESGFNDFKFKTDSNALTGKYNFFISLKKHYSNGKEYFEEIGQEQIKVEEFLPDTLEIRSGFKNGEKFLNAVGWIKPEQIKAFVNVKNLFGTVASGNKVAAGLTLNPGFTSLSKYRGFKFSERKLADNSYTERLSDGTTDENGEAEFDIDLEKYSKASFALTFNATGFEKESGRGVSTAATVYVSPLDYLVGWKCDGDLSYVGKNAKRKLSFIAIDRNLEKTKVDNIDFSITETKYVSVLVRQPNGVYKYQSVRKDFPVETKSISIGSDGLEMDLPISNEGEFTIELNGKDGVKLATINYSVIGAKNVQRSLARTAELEIKAEKGAYAPGETMKLFIKAPYAGSGLICVERNKVYSYKWFKSEGVSSEQTIEIPRELDGKEGNAYVTVLFKRDAKSEEIYMNPFCYAALPFNVSLSKRTEDIQLKVPEEAKPGENFEIKYSSLTGRKSKIAIFAVDEGILKVASYSKPNPMSFFFKKRALETKTYEMLDLILPEYEVIQAAQNMGAAGGGEGYSALGKNINPFKRKQNETVAYWSGIVDCDGTERTVTYKVPGHFNGRLHVFAVSVSNEAIGITDATSEIKADYVIVANAPTFTAPGDVFEVPVTVTNTVRNSKGAKVTLTVSSDGKLQIEGDKRAEFTLDEGKDSTVRFKFKTLDKNGNTDITFIASGEGKSSKIVSSMSVRPSMPYQVFTTSGMVRKGENRKDDVNIKKALYDEFASRDIHLSYLPSGMAGGLKFFLSKYPYGCTEQMTSRAFPWLFEKRCADGEEMIELAMNVISSRQKSDGSIGYWTAKSNSYDYLDPYCALLMTEAKERGYSIPENTFQKLLSRLKTIANSSSSYAYSKAFAIYVLTRNEVVTKNYLDSLRLDLTKDESMTATGIFAASSYKMLGMDDEAKKLLSRIRRNANRGDKRIRFEDDLFFNSLYLGLISEYFPEKLADISGELLDKICAEIENNRYNTISSAFTIMAVEKYKKIVPTVDTGKFSVIEKFAKDSKKAEKTISFSGEGIFNGTFDGDAVSLRIQNDEKTDLYYQVVHGGFAKEIPTSDIKKGIEVYREFTVDGKQTNEFKIGDTVNVKVTIRALSNSVGDVAVVDMLPAGLETDIKSAREQNNSWDSVDIREDRIVLYGTAESSVRSFEYKAKAITSGTFVAPPLFAEAMYDKTIYAYSVQKPITVTK